MNSRHAIIIAAVILGSCSESLPSTSELQPVIARHERGKCDANGSLFSDDWGVGSRERANSRVSAARNIFRDESVFKLVSTENHFGGSVTENYRYVNNGTNYIVTLSYADGGWTRFLKIDSCPYNIGQVQILDVERGQGEQINVTYDVILAPSLPVRLLADTGFEGEAGFRASSSTRSVRRTVALRHLDQGGWDVARSENG